MADRAPFSGAGESETARDQVDDLPRSGRLHPGAGSILAGRYEILGVLGRGGIGIVLRAHDRVLGEDVAVKILRPELVGERRWTARLAREVKLARQIHHPNVCRVFDFVQSGEQAFIVMELAERTLRDELQAAGRAAAGDSGAAEERLVDARAVASGLAAIHEAGIVHRDVTPQNVLRLRDGRLVVSDFGFAVEVDESTASVHGGTIAYMAPELASGGRASTASDIWALGVVIHEIVFGQRPVWRNGVMGARVEGRAAAADWEREILRVCRECTVVAPSRRPRAVGDVARRLESVAGLRTRSRGRRHRRLVAVGLCAGLAAVATLIGSGIKRRSSGGAAISSPRPDEQPLIEITGTPEDWTTSSRVLAEVPAKVHCLASVPGTRTIRFGWGYPIHVDEIDLDSGARRPAPLVPEATAEGCPDLSPDGRELIFQGYDQQGRAAIFRSPNPDGAGATVAVAAADPSLVSEPRWFAGGDAFVFDADTRHVGVVDRRTGRTAIVAEAPQPGDWSLFRFVCRNSLYAVAVGDEKRVSLDSFEWPSLELHGHTVVKNYSTIWQSDDCRKFYTFESPGDSVVELDLARREARRIGRISERRPGLVMRAGDDLVFSAAAVRSDVWSRAAGGGMKRITDTGDFYQAVECSSGEVLAVRWPSGAGSTEIRRLEPDGSFESLVRGLVFLPACSRRGSPWWWYTSQLEVPSKTFRCDRQLRCKVIAQGVGLGFALSPDETRVAFLVNSHHGIRVIWMQSSGGPFHDLGQTETGCAPGWSSDRSLWISRRLSGGLVWTEIDVDSGKTTGRTAPGSRNCTDGRPDPLSPVDDDLRVVFEHRTDIRLKRMPP